MTNPADQLPPKERNEILDIVCAGMVLKAVETDAPATVASVLAAQEQFTLEELLLCQVVRQAKFVEKISQAGSLTPAQVIRQDLTRRHPPEDLEIYDLMVEEMS